MEALKYRHDDWFKSLPKEIANTLIVFAKQFERGGTEALENPYVLNDLDVIKAGGLKAFKFLDKPKNIINEIKERLFTG